MFRSFKYLSLALVTSTFLMACGGGDGDGPTGNGPIAQDAPGQISGLGATNGKIQGTPFVLPAGIRSTATWGGVTVIPTGFVRNAPESEGKGLQVSAGESVDRIVGNGYAVTARVPLTNETDQPIDVTFPAGLVLVSNSPAYQNGVLLSVVVVRVPPRSTETIGLTTYCGNRALPGSEPNASYGDPTVASSSTLQTLLDRLKNKKINNEQFAAGDTSYWDNSQRLQEILHKLTDLGQQLDATDLAWIDSLPNK